MTTTARAYADHLDALEQYRAAALEHVNLGKLYAAAHEIRRKLDTDRRAITASLAALDSLSRTPGIAITARERAIAAGIGAQCATNAIRALTRTEVQAMDLAELEALLKDPALTELENEIAEHNLHDRYHENIGFAAYSKILDSWIATGMPNSDACALMLRELRSA